MAARPETMQPAAEPSAHHRLPQPQRPEPPAAAPGQAGPAAVREQPVVPGLRRLRRDGRRHHSQTAVVVDDEGGGPTGNFFNFPAAT